MQFFPQTKPSVSAAPAPKESDFHRDVAEPGRADLVRRVREKIDALGIQYIYYQYVSITGRVMGKAAPARHWEAQAKKGVQTWMGGVSNLTPNFKGELIGFSANAMESIALPDPETFCQLPWDKRIARVFCTLYYTLEDPEQPGEYLEYDTRGNLKRFDKEFRAKHNGLYLRVGMEPEMLWLKPKEGEVRPYEGMTQPFAYHIGQFEEVRDIWMQVYEYATAMGLDLIQGDCEDAPGQVELNYMFDDVLTTCDRMTTYRQICAEVARQRGLIACFMAKPFMGYPANGCHHNCSIWSGGTREVQQLLPELPGMEENWAYSKGGVNEFENKTGGWIPTELGHWVLGGSLAHINALTCLGASTVNSYRRFNDYGLWAPIGANWGLQNRSCAIRISSPDRMEFRAVDSMVNPHLFCGALLKAMDDGIRHKIDPGKPESRNVTEVWMGGQEEVNLIPLNLKDALDALEKDEVVRSAMPGKLYKLFEDYKRDEWIRFLREVTNWDVERYLHCLP
jgi:glutamine synthetase